MVMAKSYAHRYPYSIVGIDLSSLLWNMLERRALNPHLYQLAMPISLQNFMDIFCKLLYFVWAGQMVAIIGMSNCEILRHHNSRTFIYHYYMITIMIIIIIIGYCIYIVQTSHNM